MRFYDIVVRGRDNVRQPLAPPVLRVMRTSGRIGEVELNEDDLHSIIADAAKALKTLRARRHATVPTDG